MAPTPLSSFRRRPESTAAAARLALAVALMTVLTMACAAESPPTAVDFSAPAPPAAPSDSGPVVEVVPAREIPPLDPTADPRTDLGELRARYLPIWSPDFDWAFPPEVCGSDWALDAIAEPTSAADLAVLGDAVAAAGLSVMRYEYLLSRALAEPDVLEQLCVAVATVGPARTDALDLLASYLGSGIRSAEPAAYPDNVTIVAGGPTAVLAVACVAPGYVGVVVGEGRTVEDALAPARLGVYLLSITRGLEDTVTDISYRVSNVTDRPAEACDELDSWVAEWDQQAADWAASGEIWGPVGRTVTAEELCNSPPPDGSDECPRSWSS